jgi:hypothetical protein
MTASFFVVSSVLIFTARPLCAAEPLTFTAARDAAQRSSSTPAYQTYERSKFWPAIGTPFANAMVACTKTMKKDVVFDCVFVISTDGHIKRILHAPQQPVAACVAESLCGYMLPRPPHDSWLVLVHMATHP